MLLAVVLCFLAPSSRTEPLLGASILEGDGYRYGPRLFGQQGDVLELFGQLDDGISFLDLDTEGTVLREERIRAAIEVACGPGMPRSRGPVSCSSPGVPNGLTTVSFSLATT